MNAWYIIVPIASGYMGTGKQGSVYGKTRMDVITLLLELAFNHEQKTT